MFMYTTLQKADGQYKNRRSNAKLRKVFARFQIYPFNEGRILYYRNFIITNFVFVMRETATWFKENFETCRKIVKKMFHFI